jgi:predicted secreted protein
MAKQLRFLVPAALAALALAAAATADSPPVGALPPGPTKQVVTKRQATFTVSLPKLADPGLVWRIARPFNAAIVSESKEGETRYTVWVRFRALKAGTTSIRFAVTRGETRTALFSQSFNVVVH